MSEERTVQSINQHNETLDLTKSYNIAVQPKSGAGSGDGSPHEHFRLDLDNLLALYAKLSDVVNNLTTTVPAKMLDARQGKVLSDLIQGIIDSKGQGEGLATLDASGKIPNAQLPPLAIVDVFPDVASEQAMLELGAQQGDIAIRSDNNKVFILATEPADEINNWVELSVLSNVINDLAGIGRTNETVKGNADAIEVHTLSQLPHIFHNLATSKIYEYGFCISEDGFPQLMYKEVL